MNIIEFHYEGGLPWMLLLALMLVLNVLLIIRVAIATLMQKDVSSRLIETIKQIGLFALAWGALGTLVGLFEAFEDISAETNMAWTWQIIAGGLKVALITVLYGFGIFLFTLAALIGLNFLKKK